LIRSKPENKISNIEASESVKAVITKEVRSANNYMSTKSSSSLSPTSSIPLATTISLSSSPSSSSSLLVKEPENLNRSLNINQKNSNPAPSRKSISNLESLAASMKGKKKMTTLDKSRLDWNKFVEKEGIRDELTHYNKDGYVEKTNFLNAVDERLDAQRQNIKRTQR